MQYGINTHTFHIQMSLYGPKDQEHPKPKNKNPSKISLRDQNKVANIKALRINDQPDDSKLTAHAKLSELQEIRSSLEMYQINLIEADTILKVKQTCDARISAS